MASLNFPIKEISYYTKADGKLIKPKLDKILKNYGNFIFQASNLFGIAESLIISFIFIESSGAADAVSSAGAVGLMQVTPGSASDMIYLENKRGFLTDAKKAFIRNVIGNRLDCILKMQFMGQKQACNGLSGISITKEDLLNPAFNIFCGTLSLSILMREQTENNVVRMDKVVVRYNRGYFVKVQGTTQEIMASAPMETRNYISKLLGDNSPLQILTA